MDVAAPSSRRAPARPRLLEGTGLRLSATTDRVRALEGADFVLTTFREGGLEARRLDERVPLAFGVIGQETIGPGGFFFAMRTLPRHARDRRRPRALGARRAVVNYTNPTQIVAEALARFTDVPCIAICDQTDDDRVHLAAALGLPPGGDRARVGGLNHATWSTACRIEGEDGVARIAAAADAVRARPTCAAGQAPVRAHRAYGRVPNGYLPYYYDRDASVAEARAAAARGPASSPRSCRRCTATSRSRRAPPTPRLTGAAAARCSATSPCACCAPS
jgi:6-phospho-beta-glucosidase